jgi:hypothetical protein
MEQPPRRRKSNRSESAQVAAAACGSPRSAAADARDFLSEIAKNFPNHPTALEELTRAFDVMQHHVVNGQVTNEGMLEANKELGQLSYVCHGSSQLSDAYIKANNTMRKEAVKALRPVYTIFDRTWHPHRKVNVKAVIDWNVVFPQVQGNDQRIRLLGDPNALDSMQERHVVLETPGRPLTQIIVPSKIDVTQRTLVLHGESGCGKTITAVSRAAGEGRACVYLVMKDRINGEFGTYDETTTVDRNADAFKLLDSELKRVLECTNFNNPSCPLSEPRTGDATVVLVIDELGGNDNHRQFVRALIALRARIRENVRNLFKCREVQLVLCGTGIETSTLQPGSHPREYELHNPTADLTWRGITQVFIQPEGSLTAVLVSAVEHPKSLQSRMAHDLVSNNGRAAALFLLQTQVLATRIKGQTQPQGCVDALVENCARQAAVEYKAKSGLEQLDASQHFTCVAAALRATRTSQLPETLRDTLLTKYGLLTDRLRCTSSSATAKTVTYELPRECLGQRFAMSRSQVIIAELLSNVWQRPAAGEGFEQAFADHLLWILAGTWPKNISSLGDFPPEWEPTAPQGPVAPRGWITVADFAQTVWARPGAASSVTCRKCECPVEPQQSLHIVDEMTRGLAKGSDIIVVNADRSPFADLIVIGESQSTVMLIQCKRYLTTSLGVPTVLEELAKMGCVDASDVVRDVAELFPNPSKAGWAKNVSAYLKSRGVTECTTADMPAVDWKAELVKRINGSVTRHRLFVPDVTTQRAKDTAALMRRCDDAVKRAKRTFEAQYRDAQWDSNVAKSVAGSLKNATAGPKLTLSDCTSRIQTALQKEPTFKWRALDRALATILEDTTGGTRALGLLRTLACLTNANVARVRLEVLVVVYGRSPQPCDFLPPDVKLVYVPDGEDDAAKMKKVAESRRGLYPTRVASPDDDASKVAVELEHQILANTQQSQR